MKTKTKNLTLILFAATIAIMLFAVNANAQVTIGKDATPAPSAVLDLSQVQLQDMGLLLPKVSLTNLSTWAPLADIAVDGMFVYNTSTNPVPGIYYWKTDKWVALAASTDIPAGDNLGNHTATQNLNMNTNNINTANNITATGTVAAANVTASVKTTTQTAAITRGTDGVAPAAGNIATAADTIGNIIWKTSAEIPGAIAGVHEFLGSAPQTILEGATADVISLSTIILKQKATILITYSALPLPLNVSAPVQGSIDLYVDGEKIISSYYSASDAPTTLSRLGNYSTAQKVITGLSAGEHTVRLQAKSWRNTTTFNSNPYPLYSGSVDTDTQAMTSRLSVIVFNE